MHEIHRTVALSKGWKSSEVTPPDPIRLRRGENGMTKVVVRVIDNGSQRVLSGKVRFCAQFSLKRWVMVDCSVESGDATFVVPSTLTAADGMAAVSYLEMRDGTKSLTTDEIPVYLMDNVDVSGDELEAYRNALDALMDELEEGIKDAATATSSATQAATKADASAGRADEAANEAKLSADKADDAAKRADDAAAEAKGATTKANDAAADAESAAEKADAATQGANTAAAQASSAAGDASTAAQEARSAAQSASEAAGAASDAAGSAAGAALMAQSAAESANKAADDLQAKAEAGDFNGATFTPSWDGTTLHWENDRELPNPEDKDLAGSIIHSGTDVTAPDSPHEGYRENDLYFNEETFDLWQLQEGAWSNLATITGPIGIASASASMEHDEGGQRVEVSATGPVGAADLDFKFYNLEATVGEMTDEEIDAAFGGLS